MFPCHRVGNMYEEVEGRKEDTHIHEAGERAGIDVRRFNEPYAHMRGTYTDNRGSTDVF